jgi:DNA repair photolyase
MDIQYVPAMRREDRHQLAAGRGAVSNPGGRFEGTRLEADDDGWGCLEELPRRPETVLLADRPRRAITRNASPDVPFDQSVNPYQGCEHGCIYCFARPSHAYWNLGAGLDFETRIFHKPGLAPLLARELSAPGYECKPINLGANTDPYQPAEREHRTTRALLEVLLAHRHPVTIVTKGTLVLRDLDLLAPLAERRLCSVAVSLTTLDDDLKRVLEPRAAAPRARLRVISELVAAGVPVTVLLAPIIPALNDHEMERLVEAAAQAGASHAAFMPVRLPHELGTLFEQWLREHYPERAERVLNRVREMRGGRLNDPRFGHRMRGEGPYAALLAARFAAACRRHGLGDRRAPALDCSQFVRDPGAPTQGDLFG